MSTNGRSGPAAPPAPPAAYAVTFAAPPGRLQLRLSVSGASGQIDSDDREVVVPDTTATDLVCEPPRVYAARATGAFQVINKDPNEVPAPYRDYRRADRMVVKTAAYGPGN